MIQVQRIYDYQTCPEHTQAVFLDRLYPRGVPKVKMADVMWLKDITPSTTLRRWYHEAPEARFAEFSTRYVEELQGEAQQTALTQLRAWAKAGNVLLLSAVHNPMHSHVSVLLDYLGWQAEAI